MTIGWLPTLHLRTAQAGVQPFKHLRQAVALPLRIGQQVGTVHAQGRRLQRAQCHRLDRRAQAQLRQAFGQQSQHMAHVLGGLAQSQGQGLERDAAAPGLHVPAQLQRQQTQAACQQPGVQALEQAACSKQQAFGMLDSVRPMQLVFKDLGQLPPVMTLCLLAIGLIQGIEQGLTKATGHAGTRQTAQVLPLPAAQALEHGQMGLGRAQRRQRQMAHGHTRRLAPRQAQTQARQGLHRGLPRRGLQPGRLDGAVGQHPCPQIGQQAREPAPQAQAARDLHQHRIGGQGHARGAAQGVTGQCLPTPRLHGLRPGSERDPPHRWPPVRSGRLTAQRLACGVNVHDWRPADGARPPNEPPVPEAPPPVGHGA